MMMQRNDSQEYEYESDSEVQDQVENKDEKKINSQILLDVEFDAPKHSSIPAMKKHSEKMNHKDITLEETEVKHEISYPKVGFMNDQPNALEPNALEPNVLEPEKKNYKNITNQALKKTKVKHEISYPKVGFMNDQPNALEPDAPEFEELDFEASDFEELGIGIHLNLVAKLCEKKKFTQAFSILKLINMLDIIKYSPEKNIQENDYDDNYKNPQTEIKQSIEKLINILFKAIDDISTLKESGQTNSIMKLIKFCKVNFPTYIQEFINNKYDEFKELANNNWPDFAKTHRLFVFLQGSRYRIEQSYLKKLYEWCYSTISETSKSKDGEVLDPKFIDLLQCIIKNGRDKEPKTIFKAFRQYRNKLKNEPTYNKKFLAQLLSVQAIKNYITNEPTILKGKKGKKINFYSWAVEKDRYDLCELFSDAELDTSTKEKKDALIRDFKLRIRQKDDKKLYFMLRNEHYNRVITQCYGQDKKIPKLFKAVQSMLKKAIKEKAIESMEYILKLNLANIYESLTTTDKIDPYPSNWIKYIFRLPLGNTKDTLFHVLCKSGNDESLKLICDKLNDKKFIMEICAERNKDGCLPLTIMIENKALKNGVDLLLNNGVSFNLNDLKLSLSKQIQNYDAAEALCRHEKKGKKLFALKDDMIPTGTFSAAIKNGKINLVKKLFSCESIKKKFFGKPNKFIKMATKNKEIKNFLINQNGSLLKDKFDNNNKEEVTKVITTNNFIQLIQQNALCRSEKLSYYVNTMFKDNKSCQITCRKLEGKSKIYGYLNKLYSKVLMNPNNFLPLQIDDISKLCRNLFEHRVGESILEHFLINDEGFSSLINNDIKKHNLIWAKYVFYKLANSPMINSLPLIYNWTIFKIVFITKKFTQQKEFKLDKKTESLAEEVFTYCANHGKNHECKSISNKAKALCRDFGQILCEPGNKELLDQISKKFTFLKNAHKLYSQIQPDLKEILPILEKTNINKEKKEVESKFEDFISCFTNGELTKLSAFEDCLQQCCQAVRNNNARNRNSTFNNSNNSDDAKHMETITNNITAKIRDFLNPNASKKCSIQ